MPMQEMLPYAAMGAAGLVMLFLLLQVLLLRARLKALAKKYKYFMSGESGASLERQLSAEVRELRDMSRAAEDMLRQHEMLSQMQARSFQRCGLVKYDAFDDAGDKLSFSLALLDGENHGFILTSLVGRETSRIYIKPIMDGVPRETLSAEEAECLSNAMASYAPSPKAQPLPETEKANPFRREPQERAAG